MPSSVCPDVFSVPRCPVVFNGTNWSYFVFHMEVDMGAQQLWESLTGERTCPQRPALPMPPTYPPDVADDTKSALLEVFEVDMEGYRPNLSVY